ncbi:MAG: LTA synthase family protein, partial [Bacteroidaceae bacterium]|nr:LTA synthase family protein [Bacteroidaceae bacterium]
AGELKSIGYKTAFFHGASNGSMGFEAFAKATGFSEYYGRTEFDNDPNYKGEKEFDGNWGIWDEPFMQFYCDEMSRFKQPFMTAIFTVSSHHPFNIPEKYKKTFPEEKLEIHKCIRYTDYALRRFFESASKQKWFNNTIFVLTADHTNQKCHPVYETDLNLYSVPIIFYAPGLKLKGYDTEKIAQQIDIMPTVLQLIGYDKPYLAFGKDLINTPAEETSAVNYNNGIYQYIKNDYMMQFDGTRVTGMYKFKTDLFLKQNLVGKVPEQAQMEKELKAIIQQYMITISEDRLTYKTYSKARK